MLDAAGVLIDGRNRLAACRLAGVEPRYTALNGHDPVSYILSRNIARRHLSKGQRAMAAAMAVNFSPQRRTAGLLRVDHAYISRAKTVVEAAPELVERRRPNWPRR